MRGVYFGTVREVWPPSSGQNQSKFQYEYQVDVIAPPYATLPVRCVRVDPTCGSLLNYDDVILEAGFFVFVMFPMGDLSAGIIIGGARKNPNPQEEPDGYTRWKRVFRWIQQSINSSGDYTMQHISEKFKAGPSFFLNSSFIKFDDGGPAGDGKDSQNLIFDRENKKLTIKAGTWDVEVESGATINVTGGDITVNCENAKLNARKNVNVKSVDATVKASGNITATAGGQAKVKAMHVLLNSELNPLNGIITTKTQPTCYITGIPFKGSKTVLAGT